MIASPKLPVINRLLAALPTEVLVRLRPDLRLMPMVLRQPLQAAGEVIETVYFPNSGMISLVANLADGVQAEVGIIGVEGVLGVPLIAGVDIPFSESMVQMPGEALTMSARVFRRELDGDGPFRGLMLRYSEALQGQVMQTAACNGRHGLEQRLSRWLLMAHDRADGDELPLTQDFLAMMLGVHRPSITLAAGLLQREGLIRTSNGRISVLDRHAIEHRSCECYAAVQARYAKLLELPD